MSLLRSDFITADLTDRVVRYADLRPCYDAFIDTRTPGSDSKENFTIIGPGVSENPNQYVHITEPHGFNIGGARQPPGCVNSQHSHETVEVFYVHSGTWSFNLGEDGEDARITLRPGELISVPTHVFRGFENIGQDVGYLWAVLGKDNPGRVLWAPKVFDMAREYGLVLLDNGNLIDTRKGEVIPDGAKVMPITSKAQIAALSRFGVKQLRRCCVKIADGIDKAVSEGVSRRGFIGPNTALDWDHGFTLCEWTLAAGATHVDGLQNVSDVIFVDRGALRVDVDDRSIVLGSGDTMTIPRGLPRSFTNITDAPLHYLRVIGQK